MLPPKRILIVDDEERVLFVLECALRRLGSAYEVETAATAHEALSKARERPFDVLITDLRLPDLDGAALTERMLEITPKIPVIWITAFGDDEAIAESKRLGVRRFLHKPVEIGEIRRAVREAMGVYEC